MFIGHFAVGLGAKKYAPNLNLGVLFLACQLLDLIWPVLVLMGIETVSVDPNATTVNPMNFEYYPISHSLVMTLVYSVFFGVLTRFLFSSRRAGVVVSIVIFSHWFLDFLTHRPDLPLWLNGSKVGLGMWNYTFLTFFTETSMMVAGIFMFFQSRIKLSRRQMIAFWFLIAFLFSIYIASIFGVKLDVNTPPYLIAGPALAMWLIVLSGCYIDRQKASTSSERRRTSPNFEDGVFVNESKIAQKSVFEYLKSRNETEWSEWPEWIEKEYGPKPKARVEGDQLITTLINHASVLIQGHGYNIITDPIFSERCSPVSFIGPKRVRKPGVKFEDLPKIDLVLISHDHYDHLDLDTIDKIVERDKPKVLVGLGVGARLSDGTDFYEFDWWDTIEISTDLKATFLPVQHFSGRYLFDRDSTLWGAFLVEIGERKVYFGGDSGYADHYKKAYEKFGAMDLSLLPIGAYAPRSFMSPVHMDPAEAVVAHKDLHSKISIGIHYGTFQLTSESFEEPVVLLKEEAQKAGLTEEEFLILEFGQPFTH